MTRSRRIVIQNVYPELDCGRYPVKREVGDLFEVWADIFMEGHAKLAAMLRYRRQDDREWHEAPMQLMEPGLDRWRGAIRLEENTRYVYTITAWADPFESWLNEVEKKRGAGQDVSLELLEGRAIVEAAVGHAAGVDKTRLTSILDSFDRSEDPDSRFGLLNSMSSRTLMGRLPDRRQAVTYDHELEVTVDRIEARFAAWYEMFPRSQGRDPTRGATFSEASERLDEIRAMGFDVVYLVPIHPIGRSFRKGKNNTLGGTDEDPGSPYAIGSPAGGHEAIHPDLGTLEDFRAFVAAAAERGMEVALDFAIQCSPDHPWLKEHPDWFEYRPDGSIKYAENPPKKYQDIVNVNFFGPHQDELWRALRHVVLFWIEQGVRIFRVDNPHTKPVPFWEWLIRTVQRDHPGVIFLSESFTRPPMLRMMAKIGFTQSYSYFTWRNFKGELIDYFNELSQSFSAEYLRPNLFTNTPDILPHILQTGGRPAFQIRFVLAATLSGAYGIYNGFELCEGTPVPGTEEYLNSEKYEYKVWDWNRPGNIKEYITAINRIRRENPALHFLRNLRFHEASDGNVLFYSKITPQRDNAIFVAVNLDPFEVHESELRFPIEDLGIAEDLNFLVEDLLSGERHLWCGSRHHVRLDPNHNPAAIFRVSAWERVDFRDPRG
jgi:starch synthase (maltosyl-transferring)